MGGYPCNCDPPVRRCPRIPAAGRASGLYILPTGRHQGRGGRRPPPHTHYVSVQWWRRPWLAGHRRRRPCRRRVTWSAVIKTVSGEE